MPEARKELPLALRHGWIAFTPFPLVLFTLIVLFAGLCSSNPGRVGPVLSNRRNGNIFKRIRSRGDGGYSGV